MPKYDDLYPINKDASCDCDMVLYTGDDLIPCMGCGELCHWVEINFEAGICSTECSEKVWKEWADACNKTQD
jgi:hypothetical protein